MIKKNKKVRSQKLNRSIDFTPEPEVLKSLDAYTRARKCSRSYAVRLAVKRMLR